MAASEGRDILQRDLDRQVSGQVRIACSLTTRAESCTWDDVTKEPSTGLDLYCWAAALLIRGSWWTTSWTWVSRAVLQQRKQIRYWAASAGALLAETRSSHLVLVRLHLECCVNCYHIQSTLYCIKRQSLFGHKMITSSVHINVLSKDKWSSWLNLVSF